MVGICVATTALVVVMSVFNGFHELIESRLGILDPPLKAVATQGKAFEDADSLCIALSALPEVERALPVVSERALAVKGDRQAAIRLYGIPPELYSAFNELSLAGEPWREYYPGVESAVVSVGVANQLQAPVGTEQLMGLYVPKRVGRINPANPMAAFRTDSVAVSSAFALNQPEYDRDAVFAPLDLVRRLLQYDAQATEIHIFPSSVSTDRDALAAAQDLIGSEGKVLTRMEQQQSSFKIVNMEKWMTFILLGFILIIASFNIISSLSLLIIEKQENARTLAALGLDNKGIRGVYIRCGVLITVIGGIAGMFFGTLLSLGQQHFGWVKLAADPSMVSIESYPVLFNPADLLPIAALVASIGLATTIIASRR
ncbi:MAG: ABC transporter permease [Muribaculaceae bacterium]|nr:ABC transporter permease [Muribaculaceae bacterium]